MPAENETLATKGEAGGFLLALKRDNRWLGPLIYAF